MSNPTRTTYAPGTALVVTERARCDRVYNYGLPEAYLSRRLTHFVPGQEVEVVEVLDAGTILARFNGNIYRFGPNVVRPAGAVTDADGYSAQDLRDALESALRLLHGAEASRDEALTKLRAVEDQRAAAWASITIIAGERDAALTRLANARHALRALREALGD